MTGAEPVVLDSLEPLIAALRAEGRQVIGPTVRDGALILAAISSAAELPRGWGTALAAGSCRLRHRSDRAAFGHSAGPGRGRPGCIRRGSRCGADAGPRTGR